MSLPQPPLQLVSDYSKALYPYRLNEKVSDPLERDQQKQAILRLLHLIDARDFKVIANWKKGHEGFEIYFKSPMDVRHYGLLWHSELDTTKNVNVRIGQEFACVNDSAVGQIEQWYREAARRADLESQVNIRVHGPRFMTLETQTVPRYFNVWYRLPQEHREGIAEYLNERILKRPNGLSISA